MLESDPSVGNDSAAATGTADGKQVRFQFGSGNNNDETKATRRTVEERIGISRVAAAGTATASASARSAASSASS